MRFFLIGNCGKCGLCLREICAISSKLCVAANRDGFLFRCIAHKRLRRIESTCAGSGIETAFKENACCMCCEHQRVCAHARR